MSKIQFLLSYSSDAETESLEKRVLAYASEGNIIEADDLVAAKGREYGIKLNHFTGFSPGGKREC